jgi:hypothetical protein
MRPAACGVAGGSAHQCRHQPRHADVETPSAARGPLTPSMGWRMKAGARRGSIHGAPARFLITGGRDGEVGRRRMLGALIGAGTGGRGGRRHLPPVRERSREGPGPTAARGRAPPSTASVRRQERSEKGTSKIKQN